MTIWCLVGECSKVYTRQELEAQSIEGWNPWREPCPRPTEDFIVVPDPTDLLRYCHVRIYEVAQGENRKVAQVSRAGKWFFWVPASADVPGAFEAMKPKREGYWRTSRDGESDLPWPIPEPNWDGRATFLISLNHVETVAERVQYRGYSFCRLCGERNGHEAFRLAEWEWPAGFRHYVADHKIRPSSAFEVFIRNSDTAA